jgi:hypothetical protein
MTNKVSFYVDISADAFLEYYKGRARYVWVQDKDGRSVQFPAAALQAFVTHAGVRGHFIVHYDDDNRLIDIKKV